MKASTRTIPERLRGTLAATLLLAIMLGATTLPAQAESGIPWNDLSQEEQAVLGKHRSEWSRLTPGKQQKLRQGARQYLQLSPEKRQAVERKHNQYEQMSPREREKLRNSYRRQKSRH